MKALIDGDILLYAIGSFTNDHPFLKDSDGNPIQMPCSNEAIGTFCDDHLTKIKEGAGCNSYQVYVSGPNNFRHDIARTHPYKFKRADIEKPFHYQTVKDYLVNEKNAIVTDGIEADDALALAQGPNTVFCTVDKDLLMVPGRHYNWRKEEYRIVDYDEGVHWFLTQLLIGDWSTDSIIGCGHVEAKIYGAKAKKAGQSYQCRVGIGPKEAANLLMADKEEKLNVVVGAYKKEFGYEWKEKLNEMANLLGMGLDRDNLWDYDRVSEGYSLWLPCRGAEAHIEDDADELV